MGRTDIERGEPTIRYQNEAYQMVMQANLPSTLSEQQTQLLDQAAMDLQKAYAALLTGTGDFKAAYSAFALTWYRVFSLSDAFDAGRLSRILQTIREMVQVIPDSSDLRGFRSQAQHLHLQLYMRITDERMSLDHYNGPGTYSHLDGRFYIGEIRSGRPTGSGKISFPTFPQLLQRGLTEYTGEVVEGLPHGQGSSKYEDGRAYSGGFVRGKQQGEGHMVFPDGADYTGTWEQDRRHGQGRMKYPNGMVYEGPFVMGKREGHGRCTWPDGWVYDGEFQDDKMTGRATKTTNTGVLLTTTFVDGHANGPGTVTTPDGRVQHGVFKDDRFTPGA